MKSQITYYLKFGILTMSVIYSLLFGAPWVLASKKDGTISANSYAWGENIGWINFGLVNGNIHVTDTAVTGFAWSSTYGWINFGAANGGVTNTCTGKLGGHAWSSGLGWIPFSGVTINASGKFIGMAGTAESTAGRINFGCANCNVTTDWRQCALRKSTTTTTATATPTLAPIGFVSPISSEEEPTAPSQLFDIALIIDDPLIEDSRNLSARVTFTSFGTEDTSVDMQFVVLDENGRELYKTTGKTVIQTEGIYNQIFNNLVIPNGKYTLLLSTFYADNVRDEFRQPFEVRGQFGWLDILCARARWIIPLELMVIAILLLVRRKRRKEEKQYV